MRFTKRIITQGQVTVPTDLRNALDIHAGDLVEFEVIGIVRRKPTLNAPTVVPAIASNKVFP